MLILLLLLLCGAVHSSLFEIPVSLDQKSLPSIHYDGGSDPAQTVAAYLIANDLKPQQDLVNALNKRVISMLHTLATNTAGKELLFNVPFTLGSVTYELPLYEKMSVLLVASNFCVTHVNMLDTYEISVAECTSTVIQLTDDLHDRLLSYATSEDRRKGM